MPSFADSGRALVFKKNHEIMQEKYVKKNDASCKLTLNKREAYYDRKDCFNKSLSFVVWFKTKNNHNGRVSTSI